MSTTGNDSNVCSSSGAPCLTISAAITKASSGDTILIAEGLYFSTTGISIVKNLTLRGGWNPAFSSQTGVSSLDFMGQNGIWIENNVTIERMVFRNGSGISTGSLSVVALAKSSIYGMSSRGIQNGGTLTIENSTISGNADAGVYNLSGTIHVLNSTITNNTSSGNPNAGGIMNAIGSVEIQNSILSGNTKNEDPLDCYGNITSLGNNMIGTTSGCNLTLHASALVNVNPQVSEFLSNGYHALFSTSPAIDAGNAAACPGSDQRGVARPVGVGCDIGAFEYTAPGSAAKVMTQSGFSQVVGLNNPVTIPLKALILDAAGSPVAGKTVIFMAPASGVSGIFADSGTNQTTAVSDVNGIATASTFTANSIVGSYNITASVSGVAGNAKFAITNVALYVKSGGNDNADCLTPATACSTINGAISKAQTNAKIFVAGGTYADIDEYGYEVVSIDKSVSLSGGWDTSFSAQNQQSIIDGQNSRNGVTVYWYGGNTNVDIDNFIIKNSGDGLKIYGGNIRLLNSSLINNQNGASNQGTLTVINVTTSQNSWVGIANHRTLYVQNSTITNNLTGLYSGSYAYATINIQNSILAKNGTASAQSNCQITAGSIASTGYNLIDSISGCSIIPQATDLIGVNPLISPLLDGGFHALLGGSPAIDAANLVACPVNDQRRLARPVGSGCDIGSIEFRTGGTTPAYVFTVQGTPQNINPGSVASIPLKAAVLDSRGDPVAGTTVTFTAPAGGASGTFATTHTNVSTAVTNANGVATAAAFTANALRGSYVIQASVAGLAGSANFQLFNGTQNVKTYTTNNSTVLPGTLLCDQTKPNCTNNTNPHADAAHQYAMGASMFYANQHGRDSINNHGMTIISTVHYDSSYDNAFWNGEQMVYGDAYGYPLADDVVAHELTHGVTQYESNLFYYYQPGAINESFSDLWGEYYDQINGLGTDSTDVKWLQGEDISGLGAGRSMNNPPAYNDPDKMSSTNYYEGEDDSGGVHTNSGVNNKAVYLMVDGDTFNGKTVTALGWAKTAAIYYEVNTNLLTSGADYSDLYYALQQACSNLIGQKGITAGDCAEVKDALDAVEMNAQPAANFNTEAPLCAAGNGPSIVFADNLETGTANWIFSNGAYPRWQLDSPYGPYAQSGLHSLFADDYPGKVTDATARLKPLTIPANAHLHFAQAYGFESGYNTGDPTFYNFDGGVLEYSLNNGTTWVDAGSLIDYNGYKGRLFTGAGNPLSGRSAFVGDSHGYISTRLNLASLSGKTVVFRWRMGLDESAADWGWWVDNIRLFTCKPLPGALNKTSPANGVTNQSTSLTLSWGASTAATSYQFCYDTTNDNACSNWTNNGTATSKALGGLSTKTTYYWHVRAVNSAGTTYANGSPTAFWSFRTLDPPGAFSKVSPADGSAGLGLSTTLSWNSSPFASSYQYCYDLVDDNQCDRTWSSAPSTSVNIANLGPNTTYYWQVRAVNAAGSTDADTSNWRSFTTTPTLPTGLTEIDAFVGANQQGAYTLTQGQSLRESYMGANDGPVKLSSIAGLPLIAAERVIYKVNNVNTSFTEMMGLPDSQLDTIYWLPWYNNVDLDTQIRFANTTNTTATVHIFIGGQEMGSGFTLEAGESTRQSFAGVNNGPVKIMSDVPIVAAERVIYRVNGVNTSFSEMMALPDSQLDTTYWLPWYNNVDLDTQLRFANVNDTPATVHIYIGGVEMGTGFTLQPDESTRQSFAGTNNGPVQIVSDIPIVAAERVIYKVNNVNTSFSEMMAMPDSQLDTTYWLPWYNNVDLDTQLRFANTTDQTATVHVYIGSIEMGTGFMLQPNESTRRTFSGINNGPVQIVSDIPIVAAERAIYKINNINTSFSEMMGLPDIQLDTTYWLPWYNNKDLDTQLRFGVP